MRLARRARLSVGLALALALAGCGGGGQSTLDPHSKPARDIADLWWWMLAAATIVFLGAVALLVLAWFRRGEPGLPIMGKHEPITRGLVIVFGIGIPLVAVVALFFVANVGVMKATEAPRVASTAMTIDVIGHQWFWEIRYPGTQAVTANEIHIPVDTRVNIVGTTDDVIHSFWVPELNRKIDLIPGRINRVLLDADQAGRYRGQCAEFCGFQHANMGMYVFAQPKAQFRAWLANMSATARTPSTPLQRAGQQVFTTQCAGCHTIRGTASVGRIGPDLTHLQSRTTIAALTLPQSRLADWIRDPQRFKPGNRMPGLNLSDTQLHSVVAYLRSLR